MKYMKFFKKILFDKEKKPYIYQNLMFNELYENEILLQSPILFWAPLAGGKIESIILPFYYQFLKKDFPIAVHLIYVIPNLNMVYQLYDRIKILGARTSAIVSGGRFISIEPYNAGQLKTYSLYSDITITTLDQLFYIVLSSLFKKNKDLVTTYHPTISKSFLASSLIVLDEPHLNPYYSFSFLKALINIFYENNIPIVISTSTLPESLKSSILSLEHQIDDFNNFKFTVPIPQDYYLNIKNYNNIERDISIEIEKESLIDNYILSSRAIDIIKYNFRSLIIFNSVEKAIVAYKQLKNTFPNRDIVLYHQLFLKNDLIKKEREIQSIFSKSGRSAIVVATNMIEVATDFSFDIMLIELSPADSLLQRLSRAARKGGMCEVYIFPQKSIFESINNNTNLLFNENPSSPYNLINIYETYHYIINNSKIDPYNFKNVCQLTENLDYLISEENSKTIYEAILEASFFDKNSFYNSDVLKNEYTTVIIYVNPKNPMEPKIEETIVVNLKEFKKILKFWQTNLLLDRLIQVNWNSNSESWKFKEVISKTDTISKINRIDILPYSRFIAFGHLYDSEYGLFIPIE